MRPHRIGRTLGIGVRVAGRIVGRQLARAVEPGPRSIGAPAIAGRAASAVRMAPVAGRGVAQGLGAFLRPFGRVGGTLWLEVTGVFFLLPVLVFAPAVWRTRLSWAHGPDHRTFWVSAIFVAVFLYLGVTSFWRAHRRPA